MFFQAYKNMLSDADIFRGAELLKAGALVAFPTETVYGLGANAENNSAVAEIFALKGRPQFNPLIVHVADAASATQYVRWNEAAEKLAAAFWPGALTLVLPRKTDCTVSLLCSAGLDTLAVRVPAHTIAQRLLKAANVPIAAPSANRSGRVSPTMAAHVRDEFGDSVMVLDGGACSVGVESTVIDLTGEGPVILRPGAVTEAEIKNQISNIKSASLIAHRSSPILSPGMLESHYAPSLPVRLNVTAPRAGEALLAFGAPVPAGAKEVMNLSPGGDLKEAAANLFAFLRLLDRPGFSAIAVMPIPDEGLGIAINDRLKRAAARP